MKINAPFEIAKAHFKDVMVILNDSEKSKDKVALETAKCWLECIEIVCRYAHVNYEYDHYDSFIGFWNTVNEKHREVIDKLKKI